MFDERIRRMEEEIVALKTCPVKTATQLMTTSKTQALTFNLAIPIWHGSTPPPYAYSAKQAIITCTSTTGPMICSCHLKNNAGDVSNYGLNARSISVWNKKCGNVWQFSVIVYSDGDGNSDSQTIWQGGSVTVNYTMEITASSDFTMSVSYEDYYDGVY